MSREVVACSGMNTRAGSHSSPEVHTAPQRGTHSSPEGPDSQREGSYFLFMLFLTCVSSIDI